MKNVVLLEHRETRFPELNVSSGKEGQGLFSVDPNSKRIYVYSDGVVYELSVVDDTSLELIDLRKHYGGEENLPSLVGLSYLSVTESVCLAVANGDVLNINCQSAGEGEPECVGFVQSGLRLMEWSPDQDVVVLLTCEDTIIVMTATFDPVCETDLMQSNFGENQFITVGWGKKETQFHGTEGKAAAKSRPSDQPCLKSESDKGYPQISWRGDGTMFAVNCVNKEVGSRFVRIFGRQGELLFTSEPISGLEGVVSWRPSGNLIACTQRLPNKHVVCFLEKNGLRHGDFTLPFPTNAANVCQLLWNADSTMLLAWCQAVEGGPPLPGLAQGGSCILLWTVNNYHWYLKQRIDLAEDGSPVALQWDQLDGKRLHILCKGGRYVTYDFSWCVNHSQGVGQSDNAFVAVIDGESLLVTSFRHTVIPPPMCGTTLKLPAAALEVMFAPSYVPLPSLKEPESRESSRVLNTSSAEDSGFGETVESLGSNSNNFCAVISNGSIAAFSYLNGPRVNNPSHVLVGTYQLEWDCEGPPISIQHLHHWTWVTPETIVFSATCKKKSFLCITDVQSIGSADDGHIVVKKKIQLEDTVLCISAGTSGKTVLIQVSDGTVLEYKFEDSTVGPLFSFPQPVMEMFACRVSESTGDTTEMVLGLTNHYRLYANSILLLSNVTSVALHSNFLLVSTSQHELLSSPLNRSSILAMAKEAGSNPIGTGVASRRVERGSRLVVAVPESNRVILQMPRGNLECIEPRALSLYQLASLLNSALYHEAFDLARKQRINLNLLVDHNPSLFMNNVELFVSRVANSQWLCLFLTELEDEDCTTSMYSAHYAQPRPKYFSTKVHSICDNILLAFKKESLKNSENLRFILPQLTGLVRKGTSKALEDALAVIKNLKMQEASKNDLSIHWTDALRHLLYLKDVDQLMDAALGMYDFELVVMVASKSNKDPKEYLAFLNNLRQMEINYRKFSIDKHLRKWESALEHLMQCPDNRNEEMQEFIKQQGLFRVALQLLPSTDERYKIVASLYGEKLLYQRHYKEAGAMFRRATDYKRALHCHQKAMAWRECILDASKLKLSETEQSDILSDLCTELQEAHQFTDAAIVYHYYLNNPTEAVKVLCMGHNWEEALRTAYISNDAQSIETVIHPAALEYAQFLTLQVKTAEEQFNTFKTRIGEVRIEKQKARERQEQEGEDDIHGESDLFSDTSSVTAGSSSIASTRSSSGRSTGSQRSSKNRRKQERKVLSLKKGNPHEELALMRALHQDITTLFSLRDEVHTLCSTLLSFGDDKVGTALQQLLASVMKKMESSFNTIWPAALALGASNETPLACGPEATSNMLAACRMNLLSTDNQNWSLLEPQYRFAPVIRPMKWELDVFKRN